MEVVEANIGNWYIQCIPQDGARISVLRFEGKDLLTSNPSTFKAPENSYGEYENRPVYGYDDCFPTVDSCIYPPGQFPLRDHGEICWLKWKVHIAGNCLICSTDCIRPKVTFIRTLEFNRNILKWKFEVLNRSDEMIPFLHVMHAVIPLKEIHYFKLPEFGKIKNEIDSNDLDLNDADSASNYIKAIPSGEYAMILLKEINVGSVIVGYQNGLNLSMSFDIELFPTLGVWWNNSAYPEEKGLERNECAFEPVPGTCSDLSKSFNEGIYMIAQPEKSVCWEITWEIQK